LLALWVKEASMTRSLWMDVEMPVTEPLAHGLRCDVCVVGAGIAGLSTAYQLSRAGARGALSQAIQRIRRRSVSRRL